MYNGSKEQPYVNPKAPVHIITGSAVSTVTSLHLCEHFPHRSMHSLTSRKTLSWIVHSSVCAAAGLPQKLRTSCSSGKVFSDVVVGRAGHALSFSHRGISHEHIQNAARPTPRHCHKSNRAFRNEFWNKRVSLISANLIFAESSTGLQRDNWQV